MVTAVEGVNGRMGKKDDKDKEKEKDTREARLQEKAGKKGVKTASSFLDDKPGLRNTLAQIEKEFGEGSIMPLGLDAQKPIEGISSGSLSVDLALGGKGFPRGRIIEVFGPESSGKTTIALHSVAAASRPSSTPSTRSTRVGPRSWASRSRACSSASRRAARKR